MRWISRKEFWSKAAGGALDLDTWCYFEISEKDLREKIGAQEPERDLSGEDDPPGPLSRWYGDIEGVPFLLDFHHAHPRGEAVTIRHIDAPDAREKIRSEFKLWGKNWDESKAS